MFKADRRPGSIILWLAALLLAACGWQLATPRPTPTNEPPLGLTDRSVLTGKPCAAPCWQGLILGQSSKAEALDVARSLPFIDPTHFPEQSHTYVEGSALFPSRQPAIFVQLPCQRPAGSNCGGLQFVNEVLMAVHLKPNYQLSLGAVVQSLGDPDYVQIVPITHHATLSNQPCTVALIWKQRGVRATAGEEVRCEQVRGGKKIDANLTATDISYWLPDSLVITSVPQTDRDFAWNGFAAP